MGFRVWVWVRVGVGVGVRVRVRVYRAGGRPAEDAHPKGGGVEPLAGVIIAQGLGEGEELIDVAHAALACG